MFKNRVWILKNKDENIIALTKAHSKEEATVKFNKAYTDITILGDMITECKFDFCDIEVIKI